LTIGKAQQEQAWTVQDRTSPGRNKEKKLAPRSSFFLLHGFRQAVDPTRRFGRAFLSWLLQETAARKSRVHYG
jgi:hypothetical protein